MDQELTDVVAYVPDRRCMCTHQTVALFCVKWRHGRHLEHMRHIRNPTPSVDAYLLEEQSQSQISSRSDFKRRSRRLFWRGSPNNNNNNNNNKKKMMSSDMRSDPGPITNALFTTAKRHWWLIYLRYTAESQSTEQPDQIVHFSVLDKLTFGLV